MDSMYPVWFSHLAAWNELVSEKESEELVRAIEEIEREEEFGDD